MSDFFTKCPLSVSFLRHQVSALASYFRPLTQGAIGCASKTVTSKQQMALLDQTKTAAESTLQLLYTAKEGSGNAKVTISVNKPF